MSLYLQLNRFFMASLSAKHFLSKGSIPIILTAERTGVEPARPFRARLCSRQVPSPAFGLSLHGGGRGIRTPNASRRYWFSRPAPRPTGRPPWRKVEGSNPERSRPPRVRSVLPTIQQYLPKSDHWELNPEYSFIRAA